MSDSGEATAATTTEKQPNLTDKLPSFTCKSKMQWDRWLGSPSYLLVAGVDYECTDSQFMSRAYNAAARRYMRVRFTKTSEGLCMQSFPMYSSR